MGKKIEYIFELKLKYLKFFNLHGVMPPYNFSPKMDYWGGGGMTSGNTEIYVRKMKNINKKIFMNYFIKNLFSSSLLSILTLILFKNCIFICYIFKNIL